MINPSGTIVNRPMKKLPEKFLPVGLSAYARDAIIKNNVTIAEESTC